MTYHLDEHAPLGHFTSPFPHFLYISFRQNGPFFDPEIRCQTHHFAKLITRAIILKTTLFEFPFVPNFVHKIAKKILFIFHTHHGP